MHACLQDARDGEHTTHGPLTSRGVALPKQQQVGPPNSRTQEQFNFEAADFVCPMNDVVIIQIAHGRQKVSHPWNEKKIPPTNVHTCAWGADSGHA